MGEFRDHALREFEVLGWPGEEESQKWICDNVLSLLDVLSKQGHSGSSVYYLLELFDQLAKFKPLSPLTGKDDEWNNVSDMSEYKLWQNNRDSEVFKEADGKAYWISGRIFRDPDGGTYTSGDSHVPVEFPWTRPESEIVDVPADTDSQELTGDISELTKVKSIEDEDED